MMSIKWILSVLRIDMIVSSDMQLSSFVSPVANVLLLLVVHRCYCSQKDGEQQFGYQDYEH